MAVFSLIQQNSSALAGLVERLADRMGTGHDDATNAGVPSKKARMVVMWGGGKDSTLALVLSAAISELTGCSVRSVTMLHPGLTAGVRRNIDRIRRELGVSHEWRQFLRVILPDQAIPATEAPAGSPGANSEEWSFLYRRLAYATGFHPRFMCVACNLGSVVTEYQAMADTAADCRITGNSARELLEFDKWAVSLKRQFAGSVIFPIATGHLLLDYYRLWWAIYKQLLTELAGIDCVEDQAEFTGREDIVRKYLYELPTEQSSVAQARSIPAFEAEGVACTPSEHISLLNSLGWQLPDDIQGGTESDCAMPAAIAKLDIQYHGVGKHLEHLRQAAEALSPLPEMYDRAVRWAESGRSSNEGQRLLDQMGIRSKVRTDGLPPGTPVAMALVNQLLPVR